VRPPKLLVGIGNVLRGDDGVGVYVAWQLARRPLPREVEVYEAGTAAHELAGVLENRQRVVVVDALDCGDVPGSIHRLGPEAFVPAARSGLSLHDLHLLHALDETRLWGTAPEDVTILAVQVENTAFGIELSAPVRSAVGRAIELAAEELGIAFRESGGTVDRAEQEPLAFEPAGSPFREAD
jgi:hydrogenase maturation protease